MILAILLAALQPIANPYDCDTLPNWPMIPLCPEGQTKDQECLDALLDEWDAAWLAACQLAASQWTSASDRRERCITAAAVARDDCLAAGLQSPEECQMDYDDATDACWENWRSEIKGIRNRYNKAINDANNVLWAKCETCCI